jgi:hypothetical protein
MSPIVNSFPCRLLENAISTKKVEVQAKVEIKKG